MLTNINYVLYLVPHYVNVNCQNVSRLTELSYNLDFTMYCICNKLFKNKLKRLLQIVMFQFCLKFAVPYSVAKNKPRAIFTKTCEISVSLTIKKSGSQRRGAQKAFEIHYTLADFSRTIIDVSLFIYREQDMYVFRGCMGFDRPCIPLFFTFTRLITYLSI